MKKYLLLVCCFPLAVCNSGPPEEFNFSIYQADSPQSFSMKLKKPYAFQKFTVLKNTLDDTCLIGIMKLPPGKEGVIYSIEFFGDSLGYSYTPFKAKKGTLVFNHSFFDSP